MTLHRKHADWLIGRKLDPALAEEYGLSSEMRDGKMWLTVPYAEGGEIINHKYRTTQEKDHRMDSGAPLALWNADCLNDPAVRNGHAPLVITEGEWDALSAIQAGFQFAVSVPNGAPGKPTEDIETAKRYEWVDRHAEALAGVKELMQTRQAITSPPIWSPCLVLIAAGSSITRSPAKT
jgi:twinkle protein